MAYQLSSLLAATFQTTTAYTFTAIDPSTSATGSIGTMPAGFYRCYLVNSASSAGTQAAPYDLLQKFREQLGVYWLVDINQDGKTAITFRGSTSGSISFSSSTTLQQALGFTTSSLSFTSGSTVTSSYHPYGCVFSANSANSTGWQRTTSFNAYQELPNGEVYGYSDNYIKHTRKQDFRFLPTNQTYKSELNHPATPVFPVSKSLWSQPPSLENGFTGPFTVSHFLSIAAGNPVAASLGTLQSHLSGSSTQFDIVYLRPNTLQQQEMFSPSMKGYQKLTDFSNLQLILNGESNRQIYTPLAVPTGSVFSPSDISGIFAWYRSDDLVQASGTVSQVNDKTGNGRHAVQATSGSQPLYYSSGGPNNAPYWAGVVNTRYLLAGAVNDFNLLHNGTNFTIIFIARGSNQGSRVIFGTQNASGADTGFALYEGGSGFNGYVSGIGNGSGVVLTLSQPSAGWTTGSFHKSIITYDNSLTTGALTSSIDSNTAYGTKVGTPTASNSGRKLGIGSAGSGAFITDTAWCEVIIYSKKLDSTELAQINSYISSRYGL